MSSLDISKIQKRLREVALERDWDKFHTPKNLAVALSVEASELLEQFQWLNDQEALEIKSNPAKLNAVADEMGDVLYHLIRLADVLDVNLDKAFWNKLEKSLAKYPVELSRGNAKKYTEFTK